MRKKSFTQAERELGTAFVRQYINVTAACSLGEWFVLKMSGDKRKAKRLYDACDAHALYLRLHNGLPAHREYLTDEEHVKLGPLGDEFCLDLGKAAAKVLVQFPAEIRDAILYYLQDRTSLFSPYAADHIDEVIKENKK